MASVVMISFATGFFYRDHLLATNTHTYWNVVVLERFSDKTFKVQPAMTEGAEWTTCKPQTWQAGQVMDWVTIEQHLGCKDIRYQHFIPKGDLNASVR